MRRSVTFSTLGAWLIKCNPRVTPVEPMCAAGAAKASWCVADNYRTQMMRPGQRVVFWVSAHSRRGVWGLGRIVGPVSDDDGQLHVPVHIPLLAEPLTAATLAAVAGLQSMEVFRSPQQANPSWVTKTELTLIDSLLIVPSGQS